MFFGKICIISVRLKESSTPYYYSGANIPRAPDSELYWLKNSIYAFRPLWHIRSYILWIPNLKGKKFKSINCFDYRPFHSYSKCYCQEISNSFSKTVQYYFLLMTISVFISEIMTKYVLQSDLYWPLCWFSLYLLKFTFFCKAHPQRLQAQRLQKFMCVIRFVLWPNLFPNIWHSRSFLPVYT